HPEQGNVQCEFALRADHQSDPPDAPRQFSAEAHIARFASAAGHHIGEDRDATPTSDAVIRDYMRPLGIVSMLDTPVWLEGQVIGSMSFEMSRPRDWPAEDIDFAAGICTLIALAQEAEQRRDAEAKLRRLAHFDALTSLPNRHLLQDRLKQALAFAQRHRSRVALMFIDLDRFKTINDSLGHLVGDRLLTEVSHRLTASVRAEDSVARLGGDEFVVVLQDLGPVGHAATIAQNLLNAIEPPYLIDGRDLHVSGSIGIALYPDDGQDIETLMRNADTAMYHVKESGRNGFQFFTAEMNAHANALLTMENDLRLALKRGELSLHYQPQYDIVSGRIDAIEALLRWRHPQHGLVLPDTFIPLAEESGLIQQLGEWTLNRVCSQTQDWAKNGMAPIPVAINLSARQFRHPAFVTTLTSTLTDHRMDPRMVEIEITESALIKDMDATLDSFRALKAMGIRLAIDDFGTGYSSLAYLKRFPVDKLKIDRSFIRDISEDPDDRAIVSAIISMSKDLELRVVAEGVETAEQLAFLRERGCDGAQGFLFCAPMEADETHRHMADFMRSHRG
ncbi:MAG TPA: EAL domain-containing protein, partial [Burkholderiales bacterium]|nr:EAL domain-containing protein [Burkholderiales bacterium]